MLERLLTEQTHPDSADLDQLPTLQLLTVMNQADAQVAAAVEKELPRIARAVDAIANALGRGGHLIYVGAGTSGRLGVLDAAESPPTFQTPPDLVRALIAGGDGAVRRSVEGAEDDPDAGARDLTAFGFAPADAVVGIAASGRTPYVLGAVRHARSAGAITCGISCTPDSELSRAVEYPIEPLPGPEILTGSTRLRAGTATKMVLNMISTAVMVRLGHVYGNLMVNVQPTNAKLEDRARRIIRQATGVTAERASELLEAAGRSVRTAIVMEKLGTRREDAERRLAQAGGRIREALRPPGDKRG
ncbi:MAG TPA: N-acetylmuramic acid 6-phosphate etherase [Bryobacteraceae bacterium]|nr:N-acetylmuramic acid 6-phosphate etherase [Bryobacteraceae bacterium]